VALASGLLVLTVLVAVVKTAGPSRGSAVLSDQARVSSLPALPVGAGPAVDLFRGIGTWVSIYDGFPAYQTGGRPAPVGPQDVSKMAEQGIQVLFLQTAGTDARTAGPLGDRQLLSAFVTDAHLHGMRVIGWYVPTLANINTDLAHLRAIATFNTGGQHFDGVAVDIENTAAVPDPARRSAQLVTLSRQLRQAVGPHYPLAAIVVPPVQSEVINPRFWPGFPWRDLMSIYNAWIPMVYWTLRTPQSGYRDPARYTTESVARLRADLGDPSAAVHVLGGVSDAATTDDYHLFVQGAAAAGAVGASVFTYRFLSPRDLALLHQEIPPGGFDQETGTLHE
jgi:hypothetical protein